MHQRITDTFKILLLSGIFLMIGWCVFILQIPAREKSLFQLQQEYAQQIQRDLNQLLEPVVGAGNIETIAQVRLQQIDQTVVSKDLSSPYKQNTTTTHYQGPALKTQHISILLNSTNRILEQDAWTLVENALGIDFEQGDTLSIRMIPFIHIPFWSFGLARLTLIRIAGILMGAALLLVIILVFLYKKAQLTTHIRTAQPTASLWQKAAQIPPVRLANGLSGILPDVTAFILYRFPNELSGQIINLLPNEYVSQVMLHMNHLENLTNRAYQSLLFQSESCLRHMIQKKHAPDSPEKAARILAHSPQKDAIFAQMEKQDQQATQHIHLSTLNLDDLAKWSDNNFQILLQYLDKTTAVWALQTAPLKLHQRFAENLPVNIWQEISDRCRQMPATSDQSLTAQQKMLDIAKNLIINHLIK